MAVMARALAGLCSHPLGCAGMIAIGKSIPLVDSVDKPLFSGSAVPYAC